MPSRPRKDEVRDLLPAILSGKVAAARVLLVLCGRGRVALLLEVGLAHRGRADAVFGTGGEEQRRTRRVLVIDLRNGLRVEVGKAGLEEGARRARDVVALIDGVGIFPAERVREAPLELLGRQGSFLLQIRGLAQGRPGGPKRG